MAQQHAHSQAQQKTIEFNGKLNTSLDGIQLQSNDFVSLVNFRYNDKGIESIPGMTKFNATATRFLLTAPSTFVDLPKIRAGIQFVKNNPSENHLLVQAISSNDAYGRIIDNITQLPGSGDFEDNAVTDPIYNCGSTPGNFSLLPNQCVGFANGEHTVIWPGKEHRVGKVYNYDPASNMRYDFTEELTNNKTGTGFIAELKRVGDFTYLLIAMDMAVSGFKFYVERDHHQQSHLEYVQYVNSSNTWTGCSNVSDGTLFAGVTLSRTGEITFNSTVGAAYPSIINENHAYWYRVCFHYLDQDSMPQLSQITAICPMQAPSDIWDGTPRKIAKVWMNKSVDKYIDATNKAWEMDNTIMYVSTGATYVGSTIINLNAFASDDYLIIGSTVRLQGLVFGMAKDKNNTKSTAVQIDDWDGSTWLRVHGIEDSTKGSSTNDVSLYHSGIVSWMPHPKYEVHKTHINGDAMVYYYRVSWSAGMAARAIYIDQITVIPAAQEIGQYKYITEWRNRTVLLNDYYKDRNFFMISSVNTTSVWNGNDSFKGEVSADEELVAASSVYMRNEQSDSEVLILVSNKKTHILKGNTPKDFTVECISETYNCVNANTLRNVTIRTDKGLKNVVIWVSSMGVVMCDGATVSLISEDIGNFFDPTKPECVNFTSTDPMYSHFDPRMQEYHWVFTSGTGNTLNKEWVCDVTSNKWWEASRTPQLYGFIPVLGSGTAWYMYGFTNTGFLERLDYGSNWDGNPITFQVQLAEWLPTGTPLKMSKITGVKLAIKNKPTVHHAKLTYLLDGEATGQKVGDFSQVDTSDNRLRQIYSSVDRPAGTYHAFKLEAIVDDASQGFDPLNLALLWQEWNQDFGG